jgi:hypothetical protein
MHSLKTPSISWEPSSTSSGNEEDQHYICPARLGCLDRTPMDGVKFRARTWKQSYRYRTTIRRCGKSTGSEEKKIALPLAVQTSRLSDSQVPNDWNVTHRDGAVTHFSLEAAALPMRLDPYGVFHKAGCGFRHREKMAARPLVTVQSTDGEPGGQTTLPAVFSAPIRPDVVLQVGMREMS